MEKNRVSHRLWATMHGYSYINGSCRNIIHHEKDLKRTVKFMIPARCNEGAPTGESGGAGIDGKRRVLDNPKVDVVFGLHMDAASEVGKINYRPRGTLARKIFQNYSKKKTSHGAYPWLSVDPIHVHNKL